MKKIGDPKLNNKTGNMEQKFITSSGRKGKIIFATCPYLNCEFYTDFGKSNEVIKKHCEEKHHEIY